MVQKRKGRGRTKKYDGKRDYSNLDLKKVEVIEETDQNRIYSAKIWSVSLQRQIKVLIVYSKYTKGFKHKIFFSTDLDLKAEKVVKQYSSRFQIEFLYRDVKQNTGLNDGQSRSKEKIYFHTNIALTTINIAKIFH